MKRVFALILALCMACALFACGKKQTEVAPGGDSPTVTPGATDPGSGPAENPGGSTGVPAVQAVPEMPETAEIPPAVPAAAGPAPGWR